jgi:hypothetical protein
MTIKEHTMTRTKKSAGKTFSIVFTVALIFLITAVIIPGVNGASAVDLGSAGNYAILAKSGITTTGTTTINGNIGVSPIAATSITGFALKMDASNQFSRSSLVTGGVYAANYAPPTPAKMTAAVSAMEAAYTSAAGQASSPGLYAGNLGGRTLAPGVYKWSSGVNIPSGTDLILDGKGDSGAVWVLQISGDFTMNSASRVVLANGAQAGNVFWQVAGPSGVIIGSGAHAEGIILTQKAITLNSGATLNGRALAQTAVTLIANTVTPPSSSQAPVAEITPVSASGATTTLAAGTTPVVTATLAPGETATFVPGQTATPTPTRTLPIYNTSSFIVSGDSAIYQADVTGTGIGGLVVTGSVAPGPGQGIGQVQGSVYQYVDLAPAQDTPIDQAVVSFAVPLTWMESNQLAPGNIVLNRLDGNAWTAVPTTFVKTDGVQDYFTATVPAFSRLAITGQFTSQVISTPVVTAAQTPVMQATATQAQLAPPEVLPTTKSPFPVWVPVTAVIGALLIMAGISGRNKKNS